MPAVAGNAWTLAVGKQAAKGTPQTTPTAKLKYTGGFGPAPDRTVINLAETDASRQIGDPVVVGYRVQGSSEHYLRSVEFHKIADLLLGTTVSTGAGPYTHTASSPSSGTAGYATLYWAVNSTAIVTQMIDSQIADGDYVVIRRQESADNGEKVVAMVDQAMTLKKFYKKANQVRLEPCNSTMDPILVDPAKANVNILGVLVGVVRRCG